MCFQRVIAALTLALFPNFAPAAPPVLKELLVKSSPGASSAVAGSATLAGLTSDGAVLAGTAGRPSNGASRFPLGPFRYDAGAAAAVALPVLPTTVRTPRGGVIAVSADGSTLVGVLPSGTGNEAVRWRGGSVTGLGRPDGANTSAFCVSADGSVVYGTISGTPARLFRWDQLSGMQAIEVPTGFSLSSASLSADGQVLHCLGTVTETVPDPYEGTDTLTRVRLLRVDGTVATPIEAPTGYTYSGNLIYTPSAGASLLTLIDAHDGTSRGFRLDGSGFQQLPELVRSGVKLSQTIAAVSADMGVPVIIADEAYLYQSGAWLRLGDFVPTGISADARVVVGFQSSGNIRKPVLWSELTGLVDLRIYVRDGLVSGRATSGRWDSLKVAANGDALVIACRRTDEFGYGDILRIEASLSDIKASDEQFSAQSFLREAKPTIRMAETMASRVVNVYFPADPEIGEPAGYFPETRDAYQSSIAVTVPLPTGKTMEDLVGPLGADTPVELGFGSLFVQAKLGDGLFVEGKTSYRLTPELRLSWSRRALTLSYVSRFQSTADFPDFDLGVFPQLFVRDYSGLTSTVTNSMRNERLTLRFGSAKGLFPVSTKTSSSRTRVQVSGETFNLPRFAMTGSYAPPPSLAFARRPPAPVFTAPSTTVEGLLSTIAASHPQEISVNGGEWVRIDSIGTRPIALLPGENVVRYRTVDFIGRSAEVSRTFTDQWVAGSYTGLVSDGTDQRGFFNVLLTEAGLFTGKLILDGKTAVLKGKLASDGSVTVQLPHKPEAIFEALMQLTPGPEKNSLACTIRISDAQGAVASLTGSAGRANWGASHPLPFPFYGANAILQPDPTNVAAPPGSGFFFLGAGAGSAYIGIGKLADGTPVSFSAPVSDVLELPIFVTLAAKRGTLRGVAKFDPSQPDSDITGDLQWIRLPARSGLFAAGWKTSLRLIGGGLSNASSSQTSFPVFAKRTMIIDGSEYEVANAKLTLTGGGLAAPAILPVIAQGYLRPSYPPGMPSGRPPEYYGYGFKFYPEGAVKPVYTEFVIVPKANIVGGYFLGPAGVGNVTFGPLPD